MFEFATLLMRKCGMSNFNQVVLEQVIALKLKTL